MLETDVTGPEAAVETVSGAGRVVERRTQGERRVFEGERRVFAYRDYLAATPPDH